MVTTNNQENNIRALKIVAGISLIAGTWSLLFEIYFFHNFVFDIYFARLLFTVCSFIVFILSFRHLSNRVITILLHFIVFALISSFLYTIYKLPSTLFINIQILSLLIFTTSLIFSWDAKNQIFVAIYYNLLFALSILLNDSSIYLLPNLFSTVIYVALISMLSIAASFIILKLKRLYSEKLSENNFLFNNAPVGICKVDIDGNLIAYNNFISDVFNLTDDQKKYNLIDILSEKSHRKDLYNLIHSSGKMPLHIKNINEGSEVYLKIITNEHSLNSQHLELLLINETKEVIAEKEKEELNKKILDEKKSKIELLAKINHEVRTPLNSIISFFEMASEDIFKTMDEVKNYSRIVKVATQDLLRTINNFIDYAKIENGVFQVSRELFNLADEVSDVVTMMIPLAQNKNLKLELLNLNNDSNIVFSDIVKFRQILTNLVANAIKFTKSGNIQVSFSNKRLSGNNYEIQICIKDSGPGIPENKIKEIFNPFVTEAKGTNIQYSSGLGLAICREFIQMLNGKISVESKVGVGTEFIFEIPFVYDLSVIPPKAN